MIIFLLAITYFQVFQEEIPLLRRILICSLLWSFLFQPLNEKSFKIHLQWFSCMEWRFLMLMIASVFELFVINESVYNWKFLTHHCVEWTFSIDEFRVICSRPHGKREGKLSTKMELMHPRRNQRFCKLMYIWILNMLISSRF